MDQQFDDITPEDTGVSVHAGFPNAAMDRRGRALDFNALLIRNPSSTYIFRIRGRSHEARGIFDGDIAVIDRALDPRVGDLIICWQGGGFVLSQYRQQPAEHQELWLWGVITAVIHETRRPLRRETANAPEHPQAGGRP